MKLTGRGWAATFACAGLLAASAMFGDFLLAVLLLLALLIVASDAVWVAIVVRRASRWLDLRLNAEVEERSKPLVLTVGSESTVEARLTSKVGGRVELCSPIAFLEILPSSFSRAGTSRLAFKFRTPYSGEYGFDSLPVKVVGPIGLASSSGSLPFSLKYVVRPRIVSVAAESLRLLAKGRMGESPVDMPGAGTEFYEMREYKSGDDYRHVNWKATARQSELIVNEKMREVGGAYLLALDAVATNYSDADLLASTFLSIANSLAAAGIGFGVLVHEKGQVIEAKEVGDPVPSLATALKAALKFVKLDDSKGVMELLPVPLISAAQPEGTVGTILQTRAEEVRSQVRRSNPFQWILDQARKSTATRIVYVSELRERPEPVMELAWQTRHFGSVEFVVAVPELRGMAADDKKRTRSLQGALRAAGIECFAGDFMEVASQALTGQS